jgi:chromosome segregation ATPase
MKKFTIITSGLPIIALVLAFGIDAVEAQQPRPIINGPDLAQVGALRLDAVQKAQDAREDMQEAYQERRIDLQEGAMERRGDMIERAQEVRADRVENVQERRGEMQENMAERREEMQENFEDRREERKDNMENLREERQASMEERREMIQARFEDRKEELKTRIEERKSNLEARREEMLQNKEERRAKLGEERKERVGELFDRMFLGFSNAAERLSDIQNRIADRISQLEEDGVDVGEAQSLLETANSLLDDTVAEIEAIQAELDEAIEGEISKEYINELVSSAKESIRATHAAYRAVIAEINQ